MRMEVIYEDEPESGMYIFEPDTKGSWIVGTDNKPEINLVIGAEIIDFYEATGEREDDPDRFLVLVNILPHKDEINDETREAIMSCCGLESWDTVSYMDIMGYGATVTRLEEETFPTWDEAREYISNLPSAEVNNFDGLMIMSGFLLDRPVNMIGDTGWTNIINFVGE